MNLYYNLYCVKKRANLKHREVGIGLEFKHNDFAESNVKMGELLREPKLLVICKYMQTLVYIDTVCLCSCIIVTVCVSVRVHFVTVCVSVCDK